MTRGLEILHDMFVQGIAGAQTTIDAIRQLGKTYYDFFQQHRNFFRMFNFFQHPGLHKQVSEEMRQVCNVQTQKVWSVVIRLIQKGIEEGVLKSNLHPAETAVILWSSSTSILIRIDNEIDQWKLSLGVDLVEVLFKANGLLMDAIMTDAAKQKHGRSPDLQYAPQSLRS